MSKGQPNTDVLTNGKGGMRPWVFIGNIAEEVTQKELKNLFSDFGTILELYIKLGFASVQMASQASAEDAVEHLNGIEIHKKKINVKLASQGKSVKINTSGTSIKVENLSPMITNELLKESLSSFGNIQKAVVIADEKGSTRRGIVEFRNEISAQNAVKKIEEGCFLITSSPRPITAKLMEQEDCDYGLPEEKVTKRTEYLSETRLGPRFATRGSFEEECSHTWKIRYDLERRQREHFEESIKISRVMFESQMKTCWQKQQQQVLMIKQEVSHSDEEEGFLEERKEEFQARKRIRTEFHSVSQNVEIIESDITETRSKKQMGISAPKVATKKERAEEESNNNEEIETSLPEQVNFQEDDDVDEMPRILRVYSLRPQIAENHHANGGANVKEELNTELISNETDASADELTAIVVKTEATDDEVDPMTNHMTNRAENNIEESSRGNANISILPKVNKRKRTDAAEGGQVALISSNVTDESVINASSSEVTPDTSVPTTGTTSRRKSLRKRRSPRNLYLEALDAETTSEVTTSGTDYKGDDDDEEEEGTTYVRRNVRRRRRTRMEIQNMGIQQRDIDETPSKKVKYSDEDADELQLPISVSQLKKLKLSGLSEKQKLMLKTRGRPTPKLSLTQECTENGKMYKRTFKLHWYERKQWMCGCEDTCALYCFPCILLGGEDIWTDSGYTNIAKLSVRSGRHEQSRMHVNNMVYFALLGQAKKKDLRPEILIVTDASENDDIGDTTCEQCADICNNGIEAMKKYFCGSGGEEKAKMLIQDHGLLPKQRRCDKCHNFCGYEKKTRRFRCDRSDGKGGRCRFGVSESKGTLFVKVAATYRQFLNFLFSYLFTSFHRGELEKELNWTSTTITRWATNCNEVCTHFVKERQHRIGGPGTTVQLDEIFVCKRNDCGVRREYWILRGTEQDSDRKFFYNFEQQPRSNDSFLSIIRKFVRSGGCIVADNDPIYRQLDKFGYGVEVKDLGAQTADGIWGDLKYHVNKRGQNTEHMPLYISRYIMIKSFESKERRLHRFLQSAAHLPTQPK